MKKIVVLAFSLLLSFQSFAQDPELYRTWYLHEYLIDSTPGYQDVRDVNPPIFPNLTITESLEFSGIGSCNTFTGTMAYYNSNVFGFTSFLATNEDCESTQQDSAESHYFYMFEQENNLYFDLQELDFGVKRLTVDFTLGSLWYFSSVPLLPMPEIYNTWYLSEMTVETGEGTVVIDIDPSISPTMDINADLSFNGNSACNEYLGEFMYHEEGNFFTIHNFDATLNLCDYESHDDFETQFYSYFGINADVLYYIGGPFDNHTLTLEFATGYELVFQSTPLLSINENTLVEIKIYPNPASDQLFISSENYEIENVTIYSALGRKIQKVEDFETSTDASHLSEGMNFIEVTTSEGKSVQKLIKK